MPIPDSSIRRILLHGLLVLFAGFPAPTASAGAGGENAAAFLDIDVGARALGMGGAYVPLAMDETSLFWNPAALARIDGSCFGATHAEWYQGLQFEWAGGVTPVGQSHGAGIAATMLHSAAIAGYDDEGRPTGDFSVRDLAVTAGWGSAVTAGVAVGANVKGIQQAVAGDEVTSFAADVGVLAAGGGWRLGAVARNLGPRISYGDDSYPLPSGVMVGVLRSFGPDACISTAFATGAGGTQEARTGAEWTWNRLLTVRGGYRVSLSGDDAAAGMTMGAGIRRAAWSVDYALTPHRDLGSAHRVSLSLRFGGARSEMPDAANGCGPAGIGSARGSAAGSAGAGYALYTISRHSSLEGARAEVRALALLGERRPQAMPQGTVYRVLVGYFGTPEEAHRRAESLRGSGFETEVVGP